MVASDSTVENMNVLEQYMKKRGRPLAVYTDQAALFKTAQKTKAGESVAVGDRSELPDQKRRRMVSLVQDKVSHGSAPVASRSAGPCMSGGSCGLRHTVCRPKGAWNGDWLRLRIGVKEMRVAGVKTLEQANHYLETEFLPLFGSRSAATDRRRCASANGISVLNSVLSD